MPLLRSMPLTKRCSGRARAHLDAIARARYGAPSREIADKILSIGRCVGTLVTLLNSAAQLIVVATRV